MNAHFIASGDTISVPAGDHTLTIIGENTDNFNTQVTIKAGETATKQIIFSEYPYKPKNSFKTLKNGPNVFISTDKNSRIFVDEKAYGQKYSELILSPGKHLVKMVDPELGSIEKKINVGYDNEVRVAQFHYEQHDIPGAVKVLPGVGFLSNGQYKYAGLTYLSLGALAGSYLYANNIYNQKSDEFDWIYKKYLQSPDRQTAINRRKVADSKIDEMRQYRNTVMIPLGVSLLAVYAYTTWKGFKKPKEGYRGKPTRRYSIDVAADLSNRQLIPALHFSYNLD